MRERELTPPILRILTEAERLIGRHGVDGVSVRQVTLAAGAGNNSAVSYYFGDRDGLLRAVSEWRLPIFEEAAARLYAEAKRDGRLDDPTTVIRLMMEPQLAIKDEQGRHPHAAFLREMLRSVQGRAIRAAIHVETGHVQRMMDLLADLCPQVPVGLLRYRQTIASIAFFDAVVARDLGLVDSECRNMSDATFFAELFDMVAAICLRPPVS